MTFEAIYCPQCAHCYPYVVDALTLPCGHSIARTVKMKREIVGKYEIVAMKVRNSSQARARIMPDENGNLFVEFKKTGHHKWSLASLPAYRRWLEARSPKLLAAFEARGDVRRGAGARG